MFRTTVRRLLVNKSALCRPTSHFPGSYRNPNVDRSLIRGFSSISRSSPAKNLHRPSAPFFAPFRSYSYEAERKNEKANAAASDENKKKEGHGEEGASYNKSSEDMDKFLVALFKFFIWSIIYIHLVGYLFENTLSIIKNIIIMVSKKKEPDTLLD